MSDDYKELLQKYNSLLEENKRLKDELALLKGEARLSVPELKIPSEFSNINHYMKKDIKTKLEKLSKENLIDIISKLCEIPDVEKSLKLLVCPNKKDIERELSLFERWCNSVANNPCSEIAENGLYTSASLLWKAIDSLDANDAAKILYEMHDLLSDITEFSDAAMDIDCSCCSDLGFLLENNLGEFSEEDKNRYEYLFE